MATPGVGVMAAEISADKTWVRRVSSLSRGLTVTVVAFSLLQVVLAVFGRPPFVDVALSEMVRPMQPATAALLGAIGVAMLLLFVHRNWRDPVPRGLGTGIAVAAAVLAAVYLGAYRLGSASSLATWTRPGGQPSDPFAGIPASNEAFSALALAVALPLLATGARRLVMVGQALAAVAVAIAGRLAVEFIYGSRSLSSFPWDLSEMAVTSALCIVALGAAAILSRWDVGVVSALVGTGPGGIVLRRSLPALLLLPVILLGFVQGQQLLNRPRVFGLLAVAITGFGLVMLMSLARTLDRRDKQRAIATERALRARNALAQGAPAVTMLERQLTTVEAVGRDEIEIHAEALTESGVLAGDAHAVINLEGPRVGLILVDVAGHGANPSVTALRIKDSLVHSLRHGSSPASALDDLDPLLEETAEMATAVVADFHPASGHLRCAVAGHPPPLVIRHDAMEQLEPTGPLLHTSIRGTWTHHELTLGADDTLMLYTDGLLQRPLEDLARQMRQAPSLAEMMQWLIDDGTGRAFRDDVSVILLRRVRVKVRGGQEPPQSAAHVLPPMQSRSFLGTR